MSRADGHDALCREDRLAYSRLYQSRNRERINALQRACRARRARARAMGTDSADDPDPEDVHAKEGPPPDPEQERALRRRKEDRFRCGHRAAWRAAQYRSTRQRRERLRLAPAALVVGVPSSGDAYGQRGQTCWRVLDADDTAGRLLYECSNREDAVLWAEEQGWCVLAIELVRV